MKAYCARVKNHNLFIVFITLQCAKTTVSLYKNWHSLIVDTLNTPRPRQIKILSAWRGRWRGVWSRFLVSFHDRLEKKEVGDLISALQFFPLPTNIACVQCSTYCATLAFKQTFVSCTINIDHYPHLSSTVCVHIQSLNICACCVYTFFVEGTFEWLLL